ncbi:hypothetical protein [Alteromonas sp. C1M14]|uniref:hypothetical protein n=1 Tax=Alteromonas sp. C1M14 TaxID=2841567 RepID=UPI001C09863E|nr:hypothetical protein [Alteromonas sp. C1M14]MBU2977003.1 hypothetical protein [Alteromonas sp. C1M14]
MSDLTTPNVDAIVGAKNTQIAAIFDDQQQVAMGIQTLQSQTDLSPQQLTLIHPKDEGFNAKLEKASEKIGKRLWHSHLILGAAGIITGLIFAFILVNFGPALTQNNPMFTYIALISPGLFIGLFVAGLIGLRPDRDEIVQTVRSAIRRGKFALVVNLKREQSVTSVRDALSANSSKVIEAIQ